MGFILTTKSEAIEGEEFPFEDGGEARIGRTPGNDIVVNDNEASRNHARVFETDEGCFVEDLGSANGTFLNGKELLAQEPSLLYTGDVIAIGSGELVFWDQNANDTGKSVLPEESSEESTVIKSVEELEAEESSSSALAVAPRTPRQPAHKAPASLAPVAKASAAKAAVVKASGASAAKASLAKRANQAAAAAPSSAAERARKQREAQKSFFGRLHYAFLALDPKKRRLVVIGLVSTVLVILVAVVFLFSRGPSGGGDGSEPRRLEVGGAPVQDSFGWGKEVKWLNVNGKQFEFHVVAPGRMVAVLRYYSKDISAEEVDILFNNVSLGFIPADKLEAQENELVVPYQLIRNGEVNTLFFDNVHNPPGKETWRVWGIAVDIEPIPNFTSPAEAHAAIALAMQAAQQSYAAKNIAPANLYESWRAYRKAWLFAESLESKEAVQYDLILSRYRDVRNELDAMCAKYILDFKRTYSTTPTYERITGLLEEILRHFPKPDHYCHQEAKRALGRP